MSSDSNVPWPIWAAVTLLAACITAYATLSASRHSQNPEPLGVGASTTERWRLSGRAAEKDSQGDLANSYRGELDQTLKGGFMAVELAIRKVDEAPLEQYFKGSALDNVAALVQEERERRGQGSFQELSLQWVQETSTILPKPLRAEVFGKVRVRELVRRIDTGRHLSGPIDEEAPTAVYLRKEKGRWWIFALEEMSFEQFNSGRAY